MLSRLMNIIDRELSPLKAIEYISEIHERDKFSSYTQYNETTEMIKKHLWEAGIESAQ